MKLSKAGISSTDHNMNQVCIISTPHPMITMSLPMSGGTLYKGYVRMGVERQTDYMRCSSPAYPDSKAHGANMGPIWGRQDPGGPHVGPMNFAIWVLISQLYLDKYTCFLLLQQPIIMPKTLRLRQDGLHFPDPNFKYIFLNENAWIMILISLKFVPKGPINNIPSLF